MDGGGFNLLDRVPASGSISQSSNQPGADISGHLLLVPVFVFVFARQHVAKRYEGEDGVSPGQRAASPSKVGIKAQSCFYPLHPPQVTTRRAQSSLACASSCVCT